jgi:hypothetical protein
MLSDLRILAGRRAGPDEVFRIMLEPKGLARGNPIAGFDIGRRSGGGDIVKHSSSDGMEVLTPAPNKKAGASSLRDLSETVLVE